MASDVRDIIVDSPLDGSREEQKRRPSDEVVSWVMAHVTPWRSVRDSTHKPRWDEYHALWRGIATANSKAKKTERSRIVSPGSQMAVDLTAAEVIEALFGRRNFFGLADDASPEEREAAEQARTNLTNDLYKAGIVDVMAEAVLNGALYGTSIIKLAIDVEMRARASTAA